jgi:hypothetical protein
VLVDELPGYAVRVDEDESQYRHNLIVLMIHNRGQHSGGGPPRLGKPVLTHARQPSACGAPLAAPVSPLDRH